MTNTWQEWAEKRIKYLERKVTILQMSPSKRRDALLYDWERHTRRRR